jgi:hypothetical protein
LRSDDDAADLVADSSIQHTAAAGEVITTPDHKSPGKFYGAAARNLKDQPEQLAAEIHTGTFLKLRGSGSSQEQVVEEEAAASGTALGKVPAPSVRRSSAAAAAITVVCGKPLVAADSYSASAMRLRGHGRGSVVAATVVAGIRSSSSVAEAAASVATNRVTLLQEAPEVHEGAAGAPNLHGMEQQLVCKAEDLVGSSGNRADGIEKLRAICGDQDGGQSAGGDQQEDQRDHLTVEVNQASFQAVPVGTINNHHDDSRCIQTREEATPPGVVVDSTAARERGLEASTAALDSGVVAEEVPPAAIVVDDQSRLVSLKHSESSGASHGPKKSLAADHGPRFIQSPAAAAAAPHESVRIAIDKSSAQMMRSLSLQQASSAAETTARSAGQLAGPAAVASTTVPGTSMGSGEELGSCPVCRVFTSSSNTALNAHIDQCLVNAPSAAANSMDDNGRLHPAQSFQQTAAAHGSRAAQPKFKVKTQKKRSLAVLCAFAPRRDLEAEEESGHESGRSASRESSPAEGAASEPVQRESGIRRQPRTAFAHRGAANAAAAAPKKSLRTSSTVDASTDRSLGFVGISNPGNQCRPPAAKQQHRRLSSDSAKLPNQQPGESGKRPLSDCIEQRAAESEIQTKRKRRKLPSGKQQPATSIIPAGNVCTDSKKSSTCSSEV